MRQRADSIFMCAVVMAARVRVAGSLRSVSKSMAVLGLVVAEALVAAVAAAAEGGAAAGPRLLQLLAGARFQPTFLDGLRARYCC